ncbi:MAG TPA: phosphonate C-P lyase system protein PhnH [Acetobacteraceae bacterium]|jgi:alpha-D-ribose 1-methylphosphonate 5-triphosphate synthase subunit PhnH|nr:phosphonate C-P lyase system protein PhnH [Acetobacteraceae bacterium]
MTTLELPGFADPIGDAQASFRALLDCMARPGTLHEAAGLVPPPPLGPASASVLLTLVDADTLLWLDAASMAAREWLIFHCGAPLTEDPAAAAFAAAIGMKPLGLFSTGSDAAPEDSATLIVQLPGLGTGPAYRLSGPGLRGPALLRAEGLPADFPAQWAANHALYPRGIDLVLCAGTRFCCLPRSVRLEQA